MYLKHFYKHYDYLTMYTKYKKYSMLIQSIIHYGEYHTINNSKENA